MDTVKMHLIFCRGQWDSLALRKIETHWEIVEKSIKKDLQNKNLHILLPAISRKKNNILSNAFLRCIYIFIEKSLMLVFVISKFQRDFLSISTYWKGEEYH